ncbi:MAG TPA: fused MFS/spermidine synthase [Pirellulaceae bacterium]|nr:fused MFS/spermidine synthase [Pirellulaceae bacterium]
MCALIFQTAWLREFRLIFGATTPASAAVLAIFMGGLGLGNALLGKRADGSPNPLQMYGRLEMAISVGAIVSPLLVQLVRGVYIAVGGQDTLGIFGASALRLLLASLVIGLPTFLMGGTMPAAARAVTGADDDSRTSVGWLYGLNTLGAVLGALLSTFVLLERLGTRETLWAAAAINLCNGFIAWKLSQRWPAASLVVENERVQGSGFRVQERKEKGKKAAVGPRPVPEEAAQDQREGKPVSPAVSPQWLYAAAGIVGFAFLLMEIVWYRMLGPILGGTTFTFGLILAVALAGIGVGGALYPQLFGRRVPTLRDFALTCGWEALAMAIPLALGDRIAILTLALQDLRYFGFAGQVAAWAVIAGIVVFPAAVVSGIQFPLLVALLGRGSRDVGRHLGWAYAWNTVGAMLGSLAGGFGLLPLVGAVGAWHCVVILLAGLALALLAADYLAQRTAQPAQRNTAQPAARNTMRMLHPLFAAALAAACLFAAGPTEVWRHSGIGAGRSRAPTGTTLNEVRNWMNDKRRSIAWQADGAEVGVAISTRGGIAFLVNGKSDGNVLSDAATQIMFPMVGAMLHPNPQESLVIGLGTGESAGWLASLSGMRQVDVVEIEPAIAFVAEQCAPLNHNVLKHPKVRVIYSDARETLQTTRRQYDLIASEPSNPYRSGVASLYTVEFYDAVRKRLKPQGLFVQWLQGYEVDVATVRIVITTLREVFPNVEIWATKPGDLVLICGAEPFDYDLARLRQRLAEPAFREAVRVGWRTTDVEGVLAHFVANAKFAGSVSSGPDKDLRINTDNQNLLEYGFARTVGTSPEFSVAQLREEARSQNLHRPLTIPAGVVWEQVEDQVVAFNAGIGDAPLPPQMFAGDRGKRAEALSQYFHGNSPAVLAAWSSQPKSPQGTIESAALALAYAEAGDDKARPLIDSLRADAPVDAALLEAVLAFHKQQPAEAARLMEQTCLTLRKDPIVLPRLAEVLLTLALRIADADTDQKDRKFARRMYDALAEPFCVYLHDEKRRLTRCVLARHLGAGATAQALVDVEPFVPWDRDFLKMRWLAYRDTKHPLEIRARRDLETFSRWAPEQLVLPPPQ